VRSVCLRALPPFGIIVVTILPHLEPVILLRRAQRLAELGQRVDVGEVLVEGHVALYRKGRGESTGKKL